MSGSVSAPEGITNYLTDVKDQSLISRTGREGLKKQIGWLRDTLKVGDRVTVVAFPARDGAYVGSAREVTLANGRKVLAGMAPDGAPKQ